MHYMIFCVVEVHLHSDSRSVSLLRSCNLVQSSEFLMVRYTMQSSANRRIFGVRFSVMSLMYSRSRNGSGTVPCGTPDSTFDQSDILPFTRARCFLLCKNGEIH